MVAAGRTVIERLGFGLCGSGNAVTALPIGTLLLPLACSLPRRIPSVRRFPILWSSTILLAFALPALAHAAPRGFAWRDSIQAQIDASQPAVAESLARLALAECEADSGAGTLSMGRLFRLLGVAIQRQRGATYERVWPPLAQSGALIEKHLGSRSLEYAGVLASQSAALGGFGRVDEGLLRAQESIAIFEAHGPPQDSSVIRPLLAMGSMLGRAGRPGEARSAFERAAQAAWRLSPPDSLRAAVIRLEAALAAIQDSDLTGAEAMLDASARLIESRLTLGHPDRQRSMVIRLTHLRRTGDLIAQRRILDALIGHLEQRPGPDASLASRLSERAAVHSRLGDQAASLLDFARAAEQAEGALGLRSPITINIQVQYAELLDIGGERAKAESTFTRAFRAATELEKIPGELTAFALAGRASRLYARHDLVAARSMFEQAVGLHERSQGPRALDVAVTLLELARVTAEMGKPDTTHILAEKARRILMLRRSPEHPDFGDLAGQEAWAEAKGGDPVRAWDAALAATANHQQHMQRVQPGLPEQQALTLAHEARYRLAIAMVMAETRAVTAPGQDTARVRATWEALMASRGAVLEQLALRRHTLRANQPTAHRADSLYRLASSRYSRLLVSTAGGDSVRSARLASAQAELTAAEQAWALASGETGQASRTDRGWLARLQARLKRGQALVGIALHEAVADRPAGYMAFVTRPGSSEIVVVPLGLAATMDSLVQRWRSTFDLKRATSPAAIAALEQAATVAGAELRARMWDPIARVLGDANQVFMVPDGDMQLVNPAALPDTKGGFLIESGPTFILLTRELDLLSAAPASRAPKALLALGAPDFDEKQSVLVAANVYRGATENCSRFRDLRFAPLPATGDEVRAIAAQRPGTLLLTGARADEGSFKREAPRHRTVHLATHGFFLGEGCTVTGAGRGIGGLAAAETSVAGIASVRRNAKGEATSSPMRLSGLALAGANHRGTADAAHEDGILTAEEIAALDLTGVERVVLSACHTGVGDVLSGEGVSGLRRAFRVAGARTLVMSLWDVDDRAAADWMVTLHQQWAAGANTAEAVRTAGRTQLATRRAAQQSMHPVYWGAFVAVGEPR